MTFRAFAAAAILLGLSGAAHAADVIRVAVQKTGTVAWEIATMKALGLDKAAGLDVETIELASTEAGKIALQGGAADIIVSDWVWVARERSLGDKLLFTPYSNALGAVMAPKDLPVRSLADLAGRSIGVAGGPLDKSWLMAQAAARKEGVDLASTARPAYGAPPLIAEKLADGELDAALEFWNFCVDLEVRGFRRAIEMTDVEKALGARGPVAMTGYVFSEAFAKTHGDALRRYLDAAATARAALAEDPSAWAPDKGSPAPRRRRCARRLPQALSRRRSQALRRRGGGGRREAIPGDRCGRREESGRRRAGARRVAVLRPRRGEMRRCWPRGSFLFSR